MKSNALTQRKAEGLRLAGLYTDGAGLSLLVDGKGHKTWTLRLTVDGKRRQRGLGAFADVTLKEAREKAAIVKAGGTVKAQPKAKPQPEPEPESTAPTFSAFFESWYPVRRKGLRGRRPADNTAAVERYVYPVLADIPVDRIKLEHIKEVMAPIWADKPVAAQNLQQILAEALDVAAYRGHRSEFAPNPANRKRLTAELGDPGHEVCNHKALPPSQVPEAYAKVSADKSCYPITRQALMFTILTASRGAEVRGATWGEFDMEAGLWTVPASRMKAKKIHQVPLPRQAMEMLAEVWRQRDIDVGVDVEYVFPSPTTLQPVAKSTALRALARVGIDATTHGFRSSFRSWCAENGIDRELAELSLAHRIGDATEQSYHRSSLLDRRRVVMQQWADFCAG